MGLECGDTADCRANLNWHVSARGNTGISESLSCAWMLTPRPAAGRTSGIQNVENAGVSLTYLTLDAEEGPERLRTGRAHVADREIAPASRRLAAEFARPIAGGKLFKISPSNVPVDLQSRLSRSSRGPGRRIGGMGASWRALGTKGGKRGIAGFLVVEPKNVLGRICWDAGWSSRPSKDYNWEGLKFPNLNFLFLLCGSVADTGPVVSLYGLGELVGVPESRFRPSRRFSVREESTRGLLEGTVRERERLVADGGEGKGKGRRRKIFVQVGGGGRRRRKGSGKGEQRLVHGRFKTDPQLAPRRSAEHQAACSTVRVLRYLPYYALARHRTTSVQGQPDHHPGIPGIRTAKSPPGRLCARSKAPFRPSLTPPPLCKRAGKAVSDPAMEGARSDAQSWRTTRYETLQMGLFPVHPCQLSVPPPSTRRDEPTAWLHGCMVAS
ncbi:hypothetical protein BT67DRAFT_184377 [Trichocladium antarcticum]|uniref:Uncharacterized protein n=1 Tax=Trichocladium antarcticum TaxID=1450529 RepID=A0AAN6ZG98_9PEZI|nr:hypothetical protein BT67DRAFT_184377 [Trichocladium antarcticum]